MEPASIRFKNPGAMWGRTGPRPSADRVVPTNAPIPKRWGSKTTAYLSDGLGQGNNIAMFDTFVDGICAQLDLWRTSPRYKNKRFADAINTWDGGNNTASYIAYVKARCPGITENTIMDDAFWRSPLGIQFLKAQAGHEAGKTYPANESDWIEAQRRVMNPTVSKNTKQVGTTAVIATTTAVAVNNAAKSGVSTGTIIAIIAGAVAAIVVAWIIIHKTHKGA